MKIVYFPSLVYWIFWGIRFRNFKLYNYSNTCIPSGGLFVVSKMSIYNLLPKELYPKTVLVKTSEFNSIENIIGSNCFTFPLIAKPDKGLRGIAVQQIHSLNQLQEYAVQHNQDFLVQELCQYKNELSLFYCRLPNEKNGIITGITIKEFLTVTGDGKSTIENLLNTNPRHAMQINKIGQSVDLKTILPKDEALCLVPYGNHNRGTKFLDGKHLITPALQQTFNQILQKIDGFYFGRLDIRYNSFAELEQGKSFAIIELNGTMSEPTHIYDPKHNFFYGQKEIFRHYRILKEIVKQNLKLGSVDN